MKLQYGWFGLVCALAWIPQAHASEIENDAGDTQERVVDQPDIGEDQLGRFVLERGLYFATDIGFFMTLGGQRSYSNIQPYVAVKGGLDLNDWLSVQLVASGGFSAGNPVSATNQALVGTPNYGLYNFGGEVVAAYRPFERLSIEPHLGTGVTRVSPELNRPDDPDASLGPFTGHVVGGLDIKYLTLMTNISAGASVNTYYVFEPGIVALSYAVVLRYTFV